MVAFLTVIHSTFKLAYMILSNLDTEGNLGQVYLSMVSQLIIIQISSQRGYS